MRNTFSETLYAEATANPDVYIVVADISPAGSMAKFSSEYPERFINVGVAEQSMIGIAAGLALKGCQPFAYTIATFSLYRPFEMVRDDLCYQNLPVTVVGMGAGVIYSTLGGTHHTQEDIAIASRAAQHAGPRALRSPRMRRGHALVRAAEERAGLPAHRQGRRARADGTGRALAVRQAALSAARQRHLHPHLWRHHGDGGGDRRQARRARTLGLAGLGAHAEAARPRRHRRRRCNSTTMSS